jgi:hypothetical protein
MFLAKFKSGSLELETEENDLQVAKDWIAKLISDYPSPDYAIISDEETKKTIFEERNENEES